VKRLALPLVLTALPFAYLLALSWTPTDAGVQLPLFDDAMISMTYARTLAEGHGLVWYPGAEPVEGFTNLLWTLWMAGLHFALGDGAITSALVTLTGFAALAYNLREQAALGDQLGMSESAIRASLLMTGASFPLAFWTARGMEVGIAAALVTAACVESIRYSRGGGNVLTLALITVALFALRPEMIALTAPVWLFALASAQPRRRVLLVAGGALAAALMAGITLWRYTYYGDVVPNTFYLKATGVDLGVRAMTGLYWFCDTVAFYLAPFLVITLAALPTLPPPSRGHALLFAMTAVTSLYSIWIGGDAWEWSTKFPNRYLSCVLPLFFVLAAAATDQVTARSVRRVDVAVALAIVLGLVAYAVFPSEYRLALPGRFPTRQAAAGGVAFLLAAGLIVTLSWRAHWRSLDWPVLIVAACLAVNVPAIGFAVKSDGFDVAIDRHLTREGLALRRMLPADSSLGVTYAGSICYYSRLRCVDLYGKSDRHIARMPAVDPVFYPGHNKFDLHYSLAIVAPDYVDGLPRDADPASYGYNRVEVGGFPLYRRATPLERAR